MNVDNQKRSDAWLTDFADELHLRHVEERHISDAKRMVHEHLSDSEESPASAFGHPREYAASLDLPTRTDGIGNAGSFLTILLAIASFIVFAIMANQWIEGDQSTSTIAWCLSGAFVLLAASITLTIGIARHAIQTTIRDHFTGETAPLWSRWAPLAIAMPWLLPIFAALIVSISALRP